MLTDYFTKPLQGAVFRRMRKHILNFCPPLTISAECTGECWEGCKNDRAKNIRKEKPMTTKIIGQEITNKNKGKKKKKKRKWNKNWVSS